MSARQSVFDIQGVLLTTKEVVAEAQKRRPGLSKGTIVSRLREGRRTWETLARDPGEAREAVRNNWRSSMKHLFPSKSGGQVKTYDIEGELLTIDQILAGAKARGSTVAESTIRNRISQGKRRWSSFLTKADMTQVREELKNGTATMYRERDSKLRPTR